MKFLKRLHLTNDNNNSMDLRNASPEMAIKLFEIYMNDAQRDYMIALIEQRRRLLDGKSA